VLSDYKNYNIITKHSFEVELNVCIIPLLYNVILFFLHPLNTTLVRQKFFASWIKQNTTNNIAINLMVLQTRSAHNKGRIVPGGLLTRG